MWSNYWGWSLTCAFYFVCDPVIGFLCYTYGLIAMQILLGLIHLDQKENLFSGQFQYIVIGSHIFAWSTQFVGHGIYEKRAPAVLSNLFFLFLAPFFEMFEFLNSVTGYREAEKIECLKRVDADIAHYRLSKGYPVDETVIDVDSFKKK